MNRVKELWETVEEMLMNHKWRNQIDWETEMKPLRSVRTAYVTPGTAGSSQSFIFLVGMLSCSSAVGCYLKISPVCLETFDNCKFAKQRSRMVLNFLAKSWGSCSFQCRFNFTRNNVRPWELLTWLFSPVSLILCIKSHICMLWCWVSLLVHYGCSFTHGTAHIEAVWIDWTWELRTAHKQACNVL
jgi:hypothetical protein